MAKFKFEMGTRIRIAESNENGTVIGRAEYGYAENAVLVRYAQAGKCVEAWWTESALEAVVENAEQSRGPQ